MACANPPFSHADDDVAGLWNRELERLPCTTDPDHIRLSQDQLPPPPEGVEVLRKRYRASNDWWLETDRGWYWLDQRQMTWKPSVYGPD
jgi:hypothetical protein